MNFQDLHELLRLELLRRIELGSLTGTGLARQAGFQQAHISNFLNRKRALSLDGLDRVLAAQNLSVDQIIPVDLNAASAPPPTTDLVDAIPIVSPSTAMEEAQIRPASVIETVHVSASLLQNNRARPSLKCSRWQRFLALRVDAQQAAAMDPIIAAGAVVVLDRHYNSLAPYRAHQQTLYAVRCGAGLVLRYVEFDDGRLILRPLSSSFPVQLLSPGSHETPADMIVGRICLVISEP
jgi:Ni,Fe-hydrogenase III small subunit